MGAKKEKHKKKRRQKKEKQKKQQKKKNIKKKSRKKLKTIMIPGNARKKEGFLEFQRLKSKIRKSMQNKAQKHVQAPVAIWTPSVQKGNEDSVPAGPAAPDPAHVTMNPSLPEPDFLHHENGNVIYD